MPEDKTDHPSYILRTLEKLRIIEKAGTCAPDVLNGWHYAIAFVIALFVRDNIYAYGHFNFADHSLFSIEWLINLSLLLVLYVPLLSVLRGIEAARRKSD